MLDPLDVGQVAEGQPADVDTDTLDVDHRAIAFSGVGNAEVDRLRLVGCAEVPRERGMVARPGDVLGGASGGTVPPPAAICSR